MQGYTFISFGYIAKGDAKPVILTMGLEATNEFAGQGITPDNSAKFYAFGEEIESATYGLFRTDRIGDADPDALLDASGTDIGVVSGIVSVVRYDVTARGMSNHAGTTMMDSRKDALTGMAKLIVGAEKRARE